MPLLKHFFRLLLCSILFSTFSPLFAQKYTPNIKWKSLGPHTTPPSLADSGSWNGNGVGWFESLHLTEKSNEIFAGSISGGLFFTKDFGEKWSQKPICSPVHGVLALHAIGDTLYAGTGITHLVTPTGLGIFKSGDQGKTWYKTGLQFLANEQKPTWALAGKGNLILAATNDQIYRSTDFGLHFEEIFSQPESYFRQIVVSPHSAQVIFATGIDMYLSLDSGRTFENISERLKGLANAAALRIDRRISLSFDPNNIGRILALYNYGNKTFLEESLDDGKTWKIIHEPSSWNRYDIHHSELSISPGNSEVIYIAGVRVYKSMDNGKTFSQITQPVFGHPQFVHDDIRSMIVKNAYEVYLGTDGGVYYTNDGGEHWLNISGKGLNATMAIGFKLVPEKKMVVVGYQDLGIMFFHTKKWIHLGEIYGDGGDIFYHKQVFTFFKNGRLMEMTVPTYKTKSISNPPNTFANYYSRFIPHPKIDSTFFVVNSELSYYDGKKWQVLTKDLKGKGKTSAACVAKDNSNIIYFCYEQATWNPDSLKNRFYKTIDGGKNWEDITANFPSLAWREIKTIETNPKNHNEVYVGLGMIDSEEIIEKVFKSTNGGQTWESISQGLDPYPIFKLKYLPNSEGALILSSVSGMHYYHPRNQKWNSLNGKMPPISILDFELDARSEYIYAATYGNGLWRGKIKKNRRPKMSRLKLTN